MIFGGKYHIWLIRKKIPHQWKQHTSNVSSIQIQHRDASHIRELIFRINVANQQVHVMTLISQRSREPELRKRDACNRVKRCNNADLHFNNGSTMAVNQSAVFPISQLGAMEKKKIVDVWFLRNAEILHGLMANGIEVLQGCQLTPHHEKSLVAKIQDFLEHLTDRP